jgi:7,8-dihydroneopterin aldolase/epimerase/oxygenase
LDTITIKSLKFYGKHGYYGREREEGNHFELDVTAKGHFKDSIKKDDLDKTFDYEQVQKIAAGVFSGQSEKLIETLCHKIGERIFEQMPHLKKLNVSLRKMNPPIATPADYAEITMTWKR